MTDQEPIKNEDAHRAKKIARLAAVQALYQISYEEQLPAQIVQDFIKTNFALLSEEALAEETSVSPDAELFAAIVHGVCEQQTSLDEILSGALTAKASTGRMELLLKAIMRAGIFEIYHHAEIPSGVIINDYVDVTRAFFQAKEPGLVNAVLDNLARKMRG